MKTSLRFVLSSTAVTAVTGTAALITAASSNKMIHNGPHPSLVLDTDAAPSHNPQSKFSYAALCFVARYSHDERHYRAQLALHRVINSPQLPSLGAGPATGASHTYCVMLGRR